MEPIRVVFSWACGPSTSAVYCKPHAFYALHLRGNMADKKTKAAERKAACNKSGWTLERLWSRDAACYVDSFKLNTSLSYRIHCYCSRGSCSLLSKRYKNSKKDSSIVVWGTVSSACGLVSAVSGSIGSGLEKTTCKRFLSVPRFSEDRAIFLSFPLQNLPT